MNKKIITGIMAMVVSLFFGSTLVAVAAMPSPMMKLENFNGVIENVNVANKDFIVQYHKDKMNFTVNDTTKIFEGSKACSFSDLNKGMWASVEYINGGNQMLAQVVHVSTTQQPKHMTSSGMSSSGMMAENKTTGSMNPTWLDY